jgi:hypothetical protein
VHTDATRAVVLQAIIVGIGLADIVCEYLSTTGLKNTLVHNRQLLREELDIRVQAIQYTVLIQHGLQGIVRVRIRVYVAQMPCTISDAVTQAVTARAGWNSAAAILTA